MEDRSLPLARFTVLDLTRVRAGPTCVRQLADWGANVLKLELPEAVADLCAGIFCAMGILTALLERETTGQGQWVKTSLLQAQIFMFDFQAARWLIDHEVPPQAGNNHPTSIPTGVFKTQDGYINIASAGQAIWERFCKAIQAKTCCAYAMPPVPRVQHRDGQRRHRGLHAALPATS